MGATKSKCKQMNKSRITLLGSQSKALKEWLTCDPNGHERGAIIFFRKLSRPVKGLPESKRFLAVEIIKMTDDWVLESSTNHILINMRMFPDVYYKCEQKNLELGFVHSHPDGKLEFSSKDDVNEQNILHGLSGCNGINSCLISLILSNDKWIGRVSNGNSIGNFIPVRHISILSDRIEMYGIRNITELPENLKRQEAAFGKPFNLQLQSLRIAVVGLGGTGSPLATMLARSGIGELILIDGDHVEDSNLNRVRGYTADDINKNKAISLKRFIDNLGLNTLTTAIPKYLYESPEAIDALSSSDVIFGCTDDVIGRDILNQSIYYYAQPLIDVGLTGFVDKDKYGIPYLRDHRGRVSCILPENGTCLRCQGIVTDKKIEFEQAIRDNPTIRGIEFFKVIFKC